MTSQETPKHIKLDERNHVEKPLPDQLDGLGWEILDRGNKQHPGGTYRETFTEVVMLPVLREQLMVINPWLEDDQVEEVIKQLIASFARFNSLSLCASTTDFWYSPTSGWSFRCPAEDI